MTTAPYQQLDPVQFVQPQGRLLIDTNVFMETRPSYAGGLKPLFKRCEEAILTHSNPIVVPTKVQDELSKNSVRLRLKEPEKATKAANALVFLQSASEMGLIRKDLGDGSNPYADDLFVMLFEKFAHTYDMCLLTFDITLKLRIRLLARKTGRRLVAGYPTKSGDLSVESDAELYRKGLEKFSERRGGEREMKVLEPLLGEFQQLFGPEENAAPRSCVRSPLPKRRDARAGAAMPFSADAKIKGGDILLSVRTLPAEGSRVSWASANESGTFILGALLGAGGEGSVYEGQRSTVVKILDKDHLTQHRKEKINLLVQREIRATGICAPSAVVHNESGEFVGYAMPRAEGKEFQRTIFNPKRFREAFPEWKKKDLVDVCLAFLEEVTYLHSKNILLGDINPKNLMVDDKRRVFIIDADSWQLEGYPCPVGTPMFTAPSLLGASYSERLRTLEDENFAIATMLFMILITGQFPYMRKGTDGDMVKLIKEGNFAFQYENRNDRNQPDGDWKFMWSHVHKPVKDMFWHTFHKDGRRYRKRPDASEWLAVFKDYQAFLKGTTNFDPMSNDVYPIRNKAFRPDTPIVDCPRCRRAHAIAGIWNDDENEYFLPPLCNKCRVSSPGRTGATRSTIVPCRDCGTTFPKSQAEIGRCPACAKKDNERQARAKTLDPSRLCARCQKPFITYGNVDWHTREGKPIPTTHKRGYGGTYPAGCVPANPTHTPPTSKPSTPTVSQHPKKKGFWAWLFGR